MLQTLHILATCILDRLPPNTVKSYTIVTTLRAHDRYNGDILD